MESSTRESTKSTVKSKVHVLHVSNGAHLSNWLKKVVTSQLNQPVVCLYTKLRKVLGVQERTYSWIYRGVRGVREMHTEYGII